MCNFEVTIYHMNNKESMDHLVALNEVPIAQILEMSNFSGGGGWLLLIGYVNL